ncbi:PRD domain-containing protein [Clostridium sp. SHJSY1]|uniref:glucose PTS transporter transcription antiterminator GlcT n=1 Tax=Clostridium sp. SHJSY1 TaxID=2942483 RepID=UPI002875EAD4|nr:PRD domain-containing protein [Clostridium sp. SHJSY1]MDS0527277.1 PRD domain-containing protein [Clostridium sp. SHJSY1]
MNIELKHDEIVSKVFNNNIVLVNSDNKEKILFAKGIGFGKKPGTAIKKGTQVDKIFTIEDNDNRANFYDIIDKVDKEFFALCEECIYEVAKQINKELNESIHVGLIDHLFFAVKRMKSEEVIENPFLVEIETLYPKEFSLAKMVADRVAKYAKVRMPDDEVGFIALHIHSAINNGNLSKTLKNNYLGSTIVEHVEDRLNIEIDRKSLDYARFLTHIKFAVQRILENKNVDNQLGEIIKNTYKESYEIAKEVADIIGNELKVKVKDDEVTFLTIHIERFRISLNQ